MAEVVTIEELNSSCFAPCNDYLLDSTSRHYIHVGALAYQSRICSAAHIARILLLKSFEVEEHKSNCRTLGAGCSMSIFQDLMQYSAVLEGSSNVSTLTVNTILTMHLMTLLASVKTITTCHMHMTCSSDLWYLGQNTVLKFSVRPVGIVNWSSPSLSSRQCCFPWHQSIDLFKKDAYQISVDSMNWEVCYVAHQ